MNLLVGGCKFCGKSHTSNKKAPFDTPQTSLLKIIRVHPSTSSFSSMMSSDVVGVKYSILLSYKTFLFTQWWWWYMCVSSSNVYAKGERKKFTELFICGDCLLFSYSKVEESLLQFIHIIERSVILRFLKSIFLIWKEKLK